MIYAMQFKGRAAPEEGQFGRLKAATVAPSSLMTTVVDGDGVRGEVEEIAGDHAELVICHLALVAEGEVRGD